MADPYLSDLDFDEDGIYRERHETGLTFLCLEYYRSPTEYNFRDFRKIWAKYCGTVEAPHPVGNPGPVTANNVTKKTITRREILCPYYKCPSLCKAPRSSLFFKNTFSSEKE